MKLIRRKTDIAAVTAAGLLAAAICGCTRNSDPVLLGFEDIYGRERWETDEDYPAGYFYIERSRDLTVIKKGGSSPLEGPSGAEIVPDSYTIVLDGSDPRFTTQRLLRQLGQQAVLSFLYTSDRDLEAWIELQTLEGRSSTPIFPLEKTLTEKEYSFDLGLLIEDIAWGSVASLFTVGFSRNDGAVIDIRDIRIRSRNGDENGQKNRFWVMPPYLPNEVTEVVPITDYRTYGYEAFSYTPLNDGTWQTTSLHAGYISESLPRHWDKLSFEFRTDADVELTINWYFVEDGAALFILDAAHNGLKGPTEGWKKVTVDLNGLPGEGRPVNGTPTGLLNDIYNIPLDPTPRYLRWHVNSGGPNRIDFRGICFHE